VNTANLGKYCVDLTPACTNTTRTSRRKSGANGGVWSACLLERNLYWAGVNDNPGYSFNARQRENLDRSHVQTAQIFAYAPDPLVPPMHSNAILWRSTDPG